MSEQLYSIEAEQSVLGSLLIDNDSIDRIGQLEMRHFYDANHKRIYACIVKLITDSKPADVITVYESLQASGEAENIGGLSYLNQLYKNTPSTSNISRYSSIVLDRALMRGLLQVTDKLNNLVHEANGKKADDILEEAQTLITGLAERRSRNEPKKMDELLSIFIDEQGKLADGLNKPMPTGIFSLDEALNGGIRKSQLLILAGRPSHGKTALSSEIGLNLSDTYSGLFFSLEMGSQEVVQRAIANRGQVHLGKLLNGVHEKDDESWNRVTKSISQLQNINFAIDDTPAMSLLDIKLKSKAWKRKHGLDFIIVDYISLMSGGEGDRHEQVAAYSRGLKSLAKELDISVICLAQLNRLVESRADKKPILSDLRESGQIEQDADIVMLIHRPEMYAPENQDLRGYAEVLIRKHRSGSLSDVPLQYIGPNCKFVPWVGATPSMNLNRGRGMSD
jgi:replicative DNA helicase